jgi:DNA-binding CsgD family transcriptional regulator
MKIIKKIDEYKTKRIIDMWLDGIVQETIARCLNISQSSVQRILRNYKNANKKTV